MRDVKLPLAMFCLFVCLVGSEAAERKVPLIEVSKGAIPDDIPDGTKAALEDKPELGGTALKVTFGKDGWIAQMGPKPGDWTGFSALRFDTLNPSDQPLSLEMTVKHKGTTDYATRADVAVVLKPGKQTVEVRLPDLSNNDRSRPDLSLVKMLTIACGVEGATAYFGDICLIGEEAPPAAPAAQQAGAIRITGTIDLTITGLDLSKLKIEPAGKPEPPAPAARKAKATLLGISQGTMPRDVANVKLALVEDNDIGGIALKATFPKESWIGDSRPAIRDWRSFAALKFTAVNPSTMPVQLALTIKHQGTKDYDTRIDKDIVLAPGKNNVAVPLAGIANNNGSAPDLSGVNIWTISAGNEATVLFGDFILEADK